MSFPVPKLPLPPAELEQTEMVDDGVATDSSCGVGEAGGGIRRAADAATSAGVTSRRGRMGRVAASAAAAAALTCSAAAVIGCISAPPPQPLPKCLAAGEQRPAPGGAEAGGAGRSGCPEAAPAAAAPGGAGEGERQEPPPRGWWEPVRPVRPAATEGLALPAPLRRQVELYELDRLCLKKKQESYCIF